MTSFIIVIIIGIYGGSHRLVHHAKGWHAAHGCACIGPLRGGGGSVALGTWWALGLRLARGRWQYWWGALPGGGAEAEWFFVVWLSRRGYYLRWALAVAPRRGGIAAGGSTWSGGVFALLSGVRVGALSSSLGLRSLHCRGRAGLVQLE